MLVTWIALFLLKAQNLHFTRPNQPYHNRHIIKLPKTQLLGLENFTVHPETPPQTFVPIQIPNKPSYALRIPSGTDDLTRTPWITVLLPKKPYPRSASLGEILAPEPGKVEPTCRKGKTCIGDGFRIGVPRGGSTGNGEGSLGKLAFGGFEGHWEVLKDVPGGGGWHLYWKAEHGGNEEVPLGTPVEVEVVFIEKVGYGSQGVWTSC